MIVRPNQLESLQAYHWLWERHVSRETPTHICGYCLETEVEESGGTCAGCEEVLKELA